MRRRKVLYGWLTKDGTSYCLSRLPPDVPLSPNDCYASIQDAELSAEQRRANVVWCGPALIEKQLARGRDPADFGRV